MKLNKSVSQTEISGWAIIEIKKKFHTRDRPLNLIFDLRLKKVKIEPGKITDAETNEQYSYLYNNKIFETYDEGLVFYSTLLKAHKKCMQQLYKRIESVEKSNPELML